MMMMNVTKENDRSVLNTPTMTASGGKTKRRVSFNAANHPRMSDLQTAVPGQICSPVREEDPDGEFTSDLSVLDKKFSRDLRKRYALSSSGGSSSGGSGTPTRRQTCNPADFDSLKRGIGGKGRRLSIGGPGNGSNRRLSIGGRRVSGSGNSSETVMNDLKDQLDQREKLDRTRQQRLNNIHIKLKEKEKSLANLTFDIKKLEKENKDVSRQLREYKKRNSRISQSVLQLESCNKMKDKIIKKLLKRIDDPSFKEEMEKELATANALLNNTNNGPSSGTGSSVCGSSIASSSPSMSTSETEQFGDAHDILSKASKNRMPEGNTRRYTMAPGEVSRIRQKANEEMLCLRFDGLEQGCNSHKLYEVVQRFGPIHKLRVTEDKESGELKGYVTFCKEEDARAAMIKLSSKYRAIEIEIE